MFDINTALNETDKYVEIEIQHVAHIAAQITNVEDDIWVVAVDIVILVSESCFDAVPEMPGRHRSRADVAKGTTPRRTVLTPDPDHDRIADYPRQHTAQ